MKELVVISGKGGTGKTSITACFGALADNGVIADCDVDAADMHLLLGPSVRARHEFVGGKLAVIDREKCTGCGVCARVCIFSAVGKADNVYRVDETACEGCKVCVEFCPVAAIDFVDSVNGDWFISDTRFGPMVHAKLGIAEENSGKLVSLIRKEARKAAEEQGKELVLVDGSPGVGCPVIASIGGADMVLIVTEPTQSGLHDLHRVAELVKHFELPGAICVNKWDINKAMSEQIETEAQEIGMPVVGRIGYDRAVTESQIARKTLVEYSKCETAERITKMWEDVTALL
ncbi:electron transport complex protein RnfB [Anaerohalosphaera lusitana]|uniref:Electron transport complex protein RnfB n=1 Tax=Anaerohalosphaera lusitana TaxID=1936003 RepID=A0A1U9NM21_9BACT|nr:ATP-binding protein [Anaerohalosphaera lusitana]AQT68640.1 electron transport complex protein RnfB [Anaerohalosphaera lusitana]